MIKQALLILFYLLSNAADATVLFTVNDRIQSYEPPVRLSKILEYNNNKDIYWPASQLFKRLDNSNLLNTFSDSLIEEQWTNAEKVAAMVSRWDVQQRIAINVDLDLSRFNLEMNPLFNEGSYILRLSSRPKHVILIIDGEEQRVPYQNDWCEIAPLRSHLHNVEHHNDFIYSIDLAGTVSKIPVAYWNSRCSSIAPGITLFVPLYHPTLGFENKLNTIMLSLLKHRVSQ